MIHNNEVLEKTIETAAAFTEKYNDLELYIVQNVYGKIIVYADTLQKELVAHLERELTDKIDVWLNACELLKENIFAETEIEIWKQESAPVRNRVWVFEKYITNVYWECEKKKESKMSLIWQAGKFLLL